MARETGIEPATSTVTGWYSNQLSYSPAQEREKVQSSFFTVKAKKMARETGIEPATSTVTGWYSNQLSYSPA